MQRILESWVGFLLKLSDLILQNLTTTALSIISNINPQVIA